MKRNLEHAYAASGKGKSTRTDGGKVLGKEKGKSSSIGACYIKGKGSHNIQGTAHRTGKVISWKK